MGPCGLRHRAGSSMVDSSKVSEGSWSTVKLLSTFNHAHAMMMDSCSSELECCLLWKALFGLHPSPSHPCPILSLFHSHPIPSHLHPILSSCPCPSHPQHWLCSELLFLEGMEGEVRLQATGEGDGHQQKPGPSNNSGHSHAGWILLVPLL